MNEKHCPGCDQYLQRDDFYPKGTGVSGTIYRTRLCRECHKIKRNADPQEEVYLARWRKKNRERWNSYMKEWRKKHPGYDKRCKYLIGHRRVIGRKLWAERLEAVFDGVCVYCGSPDPCDIDHFVPKKLGGTNDLNNLVPACRSCNSRKSCTPPSEWCSPEDYERISAILNC